VRSTAHHPLILSSASPQRGGKAEKKQTSAKRRSFAPRCSATLAVWLLWPAKQAKSNQCTALQGKAHCSAHRNAVWLLWLHWLRQIKSMHSAKRMASLASPNQTATWIGKAKAVRSALLRWQSTTTESRPLRGEQVRSPAHFVSRSVTLLPAKRAKGLRPLFRKRLSYSPLFESRYILY
jgi:hypothetical protein